MNLVEIRDVLNDYRHLDAEWIIFDQGEGAYFHGIGENDSYALTPDEAEKAAVQHLERLVN